MAKYNIIANGFLASLIGSSQGNLMLTYEQLRSLCDGNESSLDVYIDTSDILYLEIDFGYRIRLDSYEMYILTASSVLNKIDFYYKNLDDDVYSLLSKDYNGSFYYAKNLPAIFAPKRLLVTLDGIEGHLAEIKALNEDYSVGFGENGDLTQIDLRDSESANTSDIHILKIKNTSSTFLVHAYNCIDYTGIDADYFVKLSADNKTFYGIRDGIQLANDYTGFNYKWSFGKLDNIKVVNRADIQLDVTSSGSTGSYTTQIFAMEAPTTCGCFHDSMDYNKYDSSFFVTNYTLASGTCIKVDAADNDCTMEIRSSNEDPLDYIKIFNYSFQYPSGGHSINYLKINTLDVKTNVNELFHDNIKFDCYRAIPSVKDTCIDYSTGDIYIIYGATKGSSSVYFNNNYIIRLDDQANILASKKTVALSAVSINDTMKAECSAEGILWWFEGHGSYRVSIFDEYLDLIASLDSIKDVSPDLLAKSNAAWVVKTTNPGAIKIEPNNTVTYIIPEPATRLVASNFDGGCWLFEDATNTLQKYDPAYTEEGDLFYKKVLTFGPVASYDQSCSAIVNDFIGNDGIWYCVNRSLIHLDNKAQLISSTHLYFTPTNLKYSSLGILVRRYNTGEWCYVDFFGNIINQGTTSTRCLVGLKASTFKYLVGIGSNILPLDFDPIWGSTGSLAWEKVSMSGYFLPKTKYHQARYTFRTSKDDNSSVIHDVTIPKPVVLKNIPKDKTKNLYIKTDFTGAVDFIEYKTRLKTWWHIQE